jgi:hypothetical protein
VTSAGETNLTTTDKSFDCFSKCIEDKTCKRLIRIHPHYNTWTNCFKKNSTIISNTPPIDGQFAIIKGNL